MTPDARARELILGAALAAAAEEAEKLEALELEALAQFGGIVGEAARLVREGRRQRP